MSEIVLEEGTGLSRYDTNPSQHLELFRQQYLRPEKDEPGNSLKSPALDISGYHTLQRLLLLSGYEVLKERQKTEDTPLRKSTLYARVNPQQSIDILMEAKFSTKPVYGIDSGFTYLQLQGPAEFTQFLRDYERLPFQEVSSVPYLALGALGGGVVFGGVGSLVFLISVPVLGYLFTGLLGVVGAIVGGGAGAEVAKEKSDELTKHFSTQYQKKLLTGKEALAAALGIPLPPEKEDKRRD